MNPVTNMMLSERRCWLGTSGFSYKDWKVLFYPKGLPQRQWLSFYAKHFTTVEINATFYRYFEPSVFARWAQETPDTFRFTLKGPREITHIKRLNSVQGELERFLESIQDLNNKITVLLWQFPPSFQSDPQTLEEFLNKLPANMKHVFEFRHVSWFNPAVYTLLEHYKAGLVTSDSNRFPATQTITGNIVYLRFHGPGALYASLYDLTALQIWATKITAWMTRYDDVYIYFNNDYDGRALQNVTELGDLITNYLVES